MKLLRLAFFVLFAFHAAESFAQLKKGIEDTWNQPQHRQFDFWIGEWTVNLRTKQKDQSWEDSRQSTARIYPILDGKAILEFWNENKVGEGIKGYSLRYFNPDINKWELWLNWPNNNRSGSSRLKGTFRHRRGEFFATYQQMDTTELIARYTFSDITPYSLRWDDAYSMDGGKTWGNNWIMEFSRKEDYPTPLYADKDPLTYDRGERCDLPQFRTFEQIQGRRKGKLKIKDEVGNWIETSATLTTHKILDGCAVISFLEYKWAGEQVKVFSHKTYIQHLDIYEDGRLDNRKDSPYRAYYGNEENGKIVLTLTDEETNEPLNEKYEWSLSDKGFQLTVLRKTMANEWEKVIQGNFK